MSSQINPSLINPSVPVSGQNNPAQALRSNFLATQNNFQETQNEINDLINKVIVSAPLTNGDNSNLNNFGGMPASNVSIYDFSYASFDFGTLTTSQTVNLDFTLGYYNTMEIGGTNTVITINPANFPGLGYSEIILEATPYTVPQYLDLSNFTTSGNIIVGSGVNGFNVVSSLFSLTANAQPYQIVLGSNDGDNWFLNVKNSGAVAISYIPTHSVGAPGDTAGKVAYGNGNLYVCVANYDGTSNIWQTAALSTISF